MSLFSFDVSYRRSVAYFVSLLFADISRTDHTHQPQPPFSALLFITMAKGKGAKGKKKRGKRDPDAPKRALSAFMFFAKENREALRVENGLEKKNIGAVGKILGAAWQEMDEAAREPYVQMSTDDKKRYQEEMEAYKNSKPQKIRKPISAYMFYVKQVRSKLTQSYPDESFQEIGKRLGTGWHALTETQKQPFTDLASEDKERYQREVAAAAAEEGGE